MNVSEARAHVRTHIQLRAAGKTNRGIVADVKANRLHKLSRGLYVDGAAWQAAKPEGQELIRTVAAHGRMRGGSAVFVATSAGAVQQLPLPRLFLKRTHVAAPRANGQVEASAPFVARHAVTIAPEDVVEVDGIPCTNLARTVADLLRTTPAETGISAIDAAMRQRAWDAETRTYDEEAAEQFRDEVARHLRSGSRGVVQARRLLAIADGRADGPGESISRLYLIELGFLRLRLQVAVPGPKGHDYHVDFGLDDAGVWGEFDGAGKYTDAALRRFGETAEDVVRREKAREDWIRGLTGMRMVRWEWAHIASAETLRRRLAAFGVFPPTR
ncbi:hypothetical protein [Microbacterium aurum]